MASTMDMPECPACTATMTPPIFLCNSGHSLCYICTNSSSDNKCPICREPMSRIRNRQLEDMYYQAYLTDNNGSSAPASKRNEAPSASNGSAGNVPANMVKVTCPNKPVGCTYKMPKIGLEYHLKECKFRNMNCPYGVVYGKCSWNGKLMDLMGHFKQHHIRNLNVSSESEIHLHNIDMKHFQKYLFLVDKNELLYLITVKIDISQKMAFWAVQHFGRKADAKQLVYEIEIVSRLYNQRKIAFTHHCFNDVINAEDIFKISKCAVVPFVLLNHFIKDNILTFNFSINEMPSTSVK